MFRRKRKLDERPALDLVEEAFHLVRRAPARALIAYCLGSLPFILGLLYFWSDMARSAVAEERLLTGSLGMSLLFFWMKGWHSVYAQTLLAQLCGESEPRWRPRWLLRTMLYQAIVQPLGLVLLPVALALLIPFGWCYSFFNNATVFAGGSVAGVKSLVGRSRRQAFLWPMQAQFAIHAFGLFGLVVFFNLFAALFAVPFLGKALLGIESIITRSPWATMNTTALAGMVALAWLCVDPFVKALFVLRCFYGESQQSGQDLRAELNSVAKPMKAAALALLAFLLALGPALSAAAAASESEDNRRPAALAGNSSVPPTELDRSIEETIQKREYSWRLPREAAAPKKKPAASEDESWIKKFFKGLEGSVKKAFRWVGDFFDWLQRQGGRSKTPGMGGFDLRAAIMPLLTLLLLALLGLLTWLIVRLWQRRATPEERIAEPVVALPDVTDESVGAEQLPEDGWLRLARDLMGRGESRLALRAFYLASLAVLAERNLIALAKFKSNRDYQRELGRRGHSLRELPQVFSENVSVFERVWYGHHDVTPQVLEAFSGNVERIRTGA